MRRIAGFDTTASIRMANLGLSERSE